MKVNPNVKILPIKIIDNSDSAKLDDLANGIKYAIDNNADIINISLGTTTPNEQLKNQVLRAIDRNISIVSSAGNISSELMYPAAENKVFSVIARDINDVDVAFSNKGLKKSFSAPGVHIKTNDNKFVSGTSFACAFMTGVISIIKQNDKTITIDEISDKLEKSCIDGNKYSYGLIQVDKF